jgi:hypothetical protein
MKHICLVVSFCRCIFFASSWSCSFPALLQDFDTDPLPVLFRSSLTLGRGCFFWASSLLTHTGGEGLELNRLSLSLVFLDLTSYFWAHTGCLAVKHKLQLLVSWSSIFDVSVHSDLQSQN